VRGKIQDHSSTASASGFLWFGIAAASVARRLTMSLAGVAGPTCMTAIIGFDVAALFEREQQAALNRGGFLEFYLNFLANAKG
jgi:hypothetical protein